jgi:hypothetical protein
MMGQGRSSPWLRHPSPFRRGTCEQDVAFRPLSRRERWYADRRGEEGPRPANAGPVLTLAIAIPLLSGEGLVGRMLRSGHSPEGRGGTPTGGVRKPGRGGMPKAG